MRTHHSVPRNVIPVGVLRNTSLPLIRTSVPGFEMRRLPARICNNVDFPAVIIYIDSTRVFPSADKAYLHSHPRGSSSILWEDEW